MTGRAGNVIWRFTHVYPSEPAPYFTFHWLQDHSRMDGQCMEVNAAAYDQMMKTGGTITHHHATGRPHLPWCEKQRPAVFGQAIAAAQRVYDLAGIMMPVVSVQERDIVAAQAVASVGAAQP